MNPDLIKDFPDLIRDFKENGISKIPKLLNDDELKKIKKICKSYSAKKGEKESWYSRNIKQLIYKLIKLKFSKFTDDIIILNLERKKKFNNIANKIFNKKSYLVHIDSYYNPIGDAGVLPWHVDQAYDGDKKEHESFVNPDHAMIKFFIYLTNVGSDNGCTSYIPKSQKIAYAVRKGIYEGILKYEPHFMLKDFRKFISKEANTNFIKKHLNDDNIINDFLEKTNFIEKGDTKEFDYSLNSGDAIIFDEGGVHKASRCLHSDRLVLRFLYSTVKSQK